VRNSNLLFALALIPSIAVYACSSSSSPSGAAPADGGTPPVADAGVDATDAAPAPVPEPPWSGTTVEPGCTANGCIHAFAHVGSYSKQLLTGYAAAGNTVLNGVVQWSITYVSSGAEITGSVFVPDTAAPNGGYGVVVMNQFTSGLGAPCAPSVGELALGVASAAALNGFVTIVPDATSYGKAPYGAYIEGEIGGRAALDAARAAFHTTQALGVSIARKAVIAGLSQGAYSTMAAATAYPYYANELEIRGFVAAEPPSNLRSGLNAALTENPQYNHVYEAMRLYSWQGLRGLSGGQIFNPPYDQLAATWFATSCIFNGTDGSDGALYNYFYEGGDDAGAPANDAGGAADAGADAASDAGSVTADAGSVSDDAGAPIPIPASQLFTSTFIGYATNDSWPADWTAEYNLSQTIPSYLTLPVTIFEGSADVTVLPAQVTLYVSQLQAAGVKVTYDQIPGGTHGTTALSSFTVQQAAGAQGVAAITQLLAN
jgi:dienelactone hydrolase